MNLLDTGYYSSLGDCIVILFIISLIICLFVLFIKRKIYVMDIILLFMVILALIATIFAINIEVSIFGIGGRYEGLFAILYYLCLLYLSSYVNKEDRMKIIIAILIFGFIHILFGFAEIVGLIRSDTGEMRVKIPGIATNPNFFGSVMVICLSYIIGLLIDSKDILIKIVYTFLFIIFVYGLLITNTTSAIIGVGAVLLFSIIYIIINKKYKELVIIVLLFVVVSVFLERKGYTYLLKDLGKTSNEIVEISKGNVNDEYGTSRIKVWKETIKVVPKYLLHGAGIDNYYYIFGDEPLRIGIYHYDKAHNEYLQILVTQGIFSLLCYLFLYFIIVMDGIINCFKEKKIYFVLPVIGYLVQAFFNISVIEVAPIFFIALGLLIDRDKVYLNRELIKR